MTMPGRKYSATGESYRYSINGQERDKELNENITTALYWEYDSRLGRRWNVDPKPNESISPYATFGNNPVYATDVLGDTSIPAPSNSKSVNWESAKASKKEYSSESPWWKQADVFWANVGVSAYNGVISTAEDGVNMIASKESRHTVAYKYGSSIVSTMRWAGSDKSLDEKFTDVKNFASQPENLEDMMAMTVMALLPTKTLKAFGGLNKAAATKYLKYTRDISAFESVEGFTLKLGNKNYVYANSLESAVNSRWSTPVSFSNSTDAISGLALKYPGSRNFAQMKFSLKNFGLYIEGTAAAQGSSMGGSTQLLQTPFTLKKISQYTVKKFSLTSSGY